MQKFKDNPELKKIYIRTVILSLVLFLSTLTLFSFFYISSQAQLENLTLQNELQKEEIESLKNILERGDNVEEPITSESTLTKDKYLFLEQHKRVFGESIDDGCDIGLMIDFPMYSFNKEEGVLRDYTGNLTALEDLIIVYGYGSSRGGAAGGGAATGLKGINEIPYTDDHIAIEEITNTGTVNINYQNNDLRLAVGEEWTQENSSVVEGYGGCEVSITETHTVTNFGIFDKDKIELQSY